MIVLLKVFLAPVVSVASLLIIWSLIWSVAEAFGAETHPVLTIPFLFVLTVSMHWVLLRFLHDLPADLVEALAIDPSEGESK
ncbi:hypothetical protein FJ955_02060 [Mesorhizobium sp. B2-2-2]|uniref:hypothetical protein n=1 Tax=Mesorhizobium sp. B2-2-2 TaxID=2589964 RepID=UPI001126ADF0|nr:hypothetical protein [Mesorhizobium sp. B2-2-2]TPM33556.1 hypothetical protein FJ955_02060 [Mesorhizobium sp. B2-2-2]